LTTNRANYPTASLASNFLYCLSPAQAVHYIQEKPYGSGAITAMSKSFFTLIFLAALLLAVQSVQGVHAGEPATRVAGTGWDNAVNSLLATGLYGFNSQSIPGLQVQLQHAAPLFLGLTPERDRINGQAITFSYEGSTGLLEFSAGYILTNQQNNREPGSVFMGLDTEPNQSFDPGRSWFLAFDLSQSYQIDDQLSFNLGSRTMLLQNPFDTEEAHIFSVLFNMPISYKKYLTITPELQWSGPVSRFDSTNNAAASSSTGKKTPEGVFYGGVSVSFSY